MIVDVLAVGLPFTLPINWAAFAILAAATRRHRDVRSLIHLRWLSLAIAVAATSLTMLAFARFFALSLGPETAALLIVGPVYLLSVINLMFLWLLWSGKW